MKHRYKFDVNGFEVQAVYEEENIREIFLPLLCDWTKMKKETGKKVIVFLSAPPGVGKTTLAQFLEYLSRENKETDEIQAAGLDGFHYHQDYILTHEAVIDGKAHPMKDVKGCPETFDIEKLKRKLEELREGPTIWPIYDRKRHDVIEEGIALTKDIILLEGNWLLSTEGPWERLITACDDSIFIYAEEELLKERLVQRKIRGGLSREEAEIFYKNCDGRNVRRLLSHHHQGRVNLEMDGDGSYRRIEERREK